MLHRFATGIYQWLGSRMPDRNTTFAQQAHRERRSIDDTDFFRFEIVKEVSKFIIAQTIVTEAKNRFNSSAWRTVYHPFQVFELQVSDSDMSYHSFLTQFDQSRQCLINHLIQVGKLNIMHIDQIDEVNIQTFHTFIYTLRRTLCRVVPCIDSVFAIASDFRRKIITVARNILQRFA